MPGAKNQRIEAVLKVLAPVPGRHAFRTGAATGAVPQALLCVAAISVFLAANDPADPVLYGLFPVLGAFLIVGLLSLAVGALCLLGERARLFGKGVLLGTALGALPFALLTLLLVLA